MTKKCIKKSLNWDLLDWWDDGRRGDEVIGDKLVHKCTQINIHRLLTLPFRLGNEKERVMGRLVLK